MTYSEFKKKIQFAKDVTEPIARSCQGVLERPDELIRRLALKYASSASEAQEWIKRTPTWS